MATDQSEPIIICSDDESDNDDVVLIKEEIEVDCDDVIFLSETKATPRSDVETSESPKQTELTPSESKCSLSSTVSLTSGTGQLSLDDSDDTDILANILAKAATSSIGPLDLSSKSTDSSEKGSDNAIQGNTSSNIQNGGDGASSDSSFMMLLSSEGPVLQTASDNSLKVKLENSSNPPSLPVDSDAVGVSDSRSAVGASCGLNNDNSLSNDQTSVRLSTMLCDNAVSSTGSADADWSAFNLSPSKRTTSTNQHTDTNSSDPYTNVSTLGCIVNTCNSVIVNTGHGIPAASNQTCQQKVREASNQSVITTQLNTTKQILRNTKVCDTDTNPPNLHVNNRRSATIDVQGTSMDLSDPFQASHALLSSLDMTLNSSTQSQTGSISQTDQSLSINRTQSVCSTRDSLNLGPSANFSNGLLGGSIQCIQPTLSPSSSTSIHNTTSPTSGFFKRSLSMIDSSTTYYNSLTLPLSQQSKLYRHSVSSGSLVSYKSEDSTNATDMSTQSPRSPSPQNSQHLPPKKQKRYYNDVLQDLNCTNCGAYLTGQKFSRCPNGHATCTKCLEERVKLVLTGRAKESVKCLNNSCDSYYPISELRHSLPAMVVEILEDKLDQDYVDFISDMIMKKASEEIDQESASGDLDQTEDGRFLKKYEDCPGNWETMDERNVNSDGYVLVPVETETKDYQDVVLQFFDSMVDHNVEVTAVYRVQNPIQWKYYMVKKSEMLRDSGGFYSVVESQLFHGTTSSSVEAICRKGFDWRVCGKHGTLYGQGSYFAKHASYSHQYTDLRRAHGAGRAISFGPPPQMTPTAFMFPPMNVNFGQPLHPVTTPVGISVIQATQFRPVNLSHNATASQKNGACIAQGSQTLKVGPSLKTNNNTVSSSSQFSSGVQPSSSQFSSGAQPSSSQFGSRTMGSMKNDLLARRKHRNAHLWSKKSLHQPIAVRFHGSQTVTYVNVNSESQQEEERPKAKVFLARVLVGKYTVGNPKLRKPPPLFPDTDQYGKCYDSCVDNEADPKIFVIFDSTQAYPEYLIEYTYSGDSLSR